MTGSIMPAKARRLLSLTGAAAFWLAVWWLLSLLVSQELLLPSPWRVAVTLWHMWGTPAFWQSVALSLLRVIGGFAAAVAAGTLLAVLTARFAWLRALLSPLLHAVRAVPVASFIILAYLWIRVQLLPGFIAFLMVLPLVWANLSEGIAQTDRRLLEMARVFHFSRSKTLRHVWLPSLRPYAAAACTTGLGFAWKSGIAAEVICSPKYAIGTELKNAKAYLETPEVFAWTVTVVLLSVLLERLLFRLVRREVSS